jgi:hypothetical protein
MTPVQAQPEVGALLRQWRERRRVTQLELARSTTRIWGGAGDYSTLRGAPLFPRIDGRERQDPPELDRSRSADE